MDLTFVNYVGIFVLASVVFLAIDMIWLNIIAKNLYQKELKKLLAKKFLAGPAALFYVLFVIGLMVMVIVPALNRESVAYALAFGAFYGFFTYMTYGLTNLATLKGWSKKLVPIDIAWGTILAGVVSAVTYSLYQVF